jgi:hypothetical protein
MRAAGLNSRRLSSAEPTRINAWTFLLITMIGKYYSHSGNKFFGMTINVSLGSVKSKNLLCPTEEMDKGDNSFK